MKMNIFAVLSLFAVGLSVVKVGALRLPRIVGGTYISIELYPFAAALLHTDDLISFKQVCGGTIIRNNVVLTTAACLYYDTTSRWRVRVGSTYGNSGGSVHSLSQITAHYFFNPRTYDSDVAVARSSVPFVFSSTVRPAVLATPNYQIDDDVVMAIGWGTDSNGGAANEHLRHVEGWTVDQAACRNNYAAIGFTITDNMLCSGWLNIGGHGQCDGDAGGPVVHFNKNVVIGITSTGYGCGLPSFPYVSTRVSSFATWIDNVA